MEHKHTREEERRIRDAALDHTIAETFPASDPLSTLPNPDDDSLAPDVATPSDPGASRETPREIE